MREKGSTVRWIISLFLAWTTELMAYLLSRWGGLGKDGVWGGKGIESSALYTVSFSFQVNIQVEMHVASSKYKE